MARLVESSRRDKAGNAPKSITVCVYSHNKFHRNLNYISLSNKHTHTCWSSPVTMLPIQRSAGVCTVNWGWSKSCTRRGTTRAWEQKKNLNFAFFEIRFECRGSNVLRWLLEFCDWDRRINKITPNKHQPTPIREKYFLKKFMSIINELKCFFFTSASSERIIYANIGNAGWTTRKSG